MCSDTCSDCSGFGYLWGSEIVGFRGEPHAKLSCLKCGRNGWLIQLMYRWYGYTTDSVIRKASWR